MCNRFSPAEKTIFSSCGSARPDRARYLPARTRGPGALHRPTWKNWPVFFTRANGKRCRCASSYAHKRINQVVTEIRIWTIWINQTVFRVPVDGRLWMWTDNANASLAKGWVQPLSVVDNSAFSPSRLTFPHEAPYSFFSERNCPCSSFQAQRILREPACVLARVLPSVLSHAAVCSLLALPWSSPIGSSSQATHQAPPSPQAAHPRQLPHLSPPRHSLVGWRASASTSLA
jgi:hypothetical protein